MFKRTRILTDGSITVKVVPAMSGYCIHITNNNEKTVEGIFPRRHIAVNVAQAILEAA